MVAALLPAQPASRPLRRARDFVPTPVPSRDFAPQWVIRVASAGAIVAGVVFALFALALYTTASDSRHFPLAAVATGGALVLHVHHLRYALADSRPPAGRWTLVALAVVILAPTPFIGPIWLQSWHVFAASALLVLGPKWGLPVCLGLSAGAAAWSTVYAWGVSEPATGLATWSALSVILRGLAPVILVWMVVALRHLEAARHALAAQAVDVERRRISDEFYGAIGGELEAIVADAVRAGELSGVAHGSAALLLRSVVSRSRRTLADARRMLRGYTMPLRGEMASAIALLTAAGLRGRLEIPDGPLPGALDEALRSALRELTSELLHEEPDGQVVVRLVRDGDRLRLQRSVEPTAMAPMEDTP